MRSVGWRGAIAPAARANRKKGFANNLRHMMAAWIRKAVTEAAKSLDGRRGTNHQDHQLRVGARD